MKFDCDGAKHGADTAVISKKVEARRRDALRAVELHVSAVLGDEFGTEQVVLSQVAKVGYAGRCFFADIEQHIALRLRVLGCKCLKDSELQLPIQFHRNLLVCWFGLELSSLPVGFRP